MVTEIKEPSYKEKLKAITFPTKKWIFFFIYLAIEIQYKCIHMKILMRITLESNKYLFLKAWLQLSSFWIKLTKSRVTSMKPSKKDKKIAIARNMLDKKWRGTFILTSGGWMK